ncbi:MAG: hypothetical protein JRI34_12610 [Deltaproteobacteria bacterium]|nr:hypothetical protein [Deltaproteobacteria bacterium]
MSINLHFTEEDWERIESDWTAWWEGELDRPMVIIETMNLLFTGDPSMFSREFLLEKPVDEVLDHYQKLMENIRYFGDAWPKLFVNHGPGIAAAFLGSDVQIMPAQHTIWFEASGKKPIQDLHLAYDPDNVWWRRIKDLTRGAVDRWGDQVAVAHTDIGGNLDILSSFLTAQQLLYDLYDAPKEVERVSKEITTAWIRYYSELHDIIKEAGRGTCNWAAVWSPGKTCMHQSDFCYMISPAMFERFVLPDLSACFDIMDHAFYHLDGKGQIPHLDMLLAMENLAGIQWIPGDGQPQAHEWPDLLKRIRDSGKRCQVYVDTNGARKIVREIGGRGFALYVIFWPPPTEDTVNDFLKVLADEDISRG